MARKNTIQVSVLLDNKNFKRGITDTKSATQSLVVGFKTMGKNLAIAFGATVVTAIATVGAALAKYVPQALAASDATDKLAKTMSFLGFDQAEIDKAKTSIQDYADTTVYGISDISNAMQQFAALGIPYYKELAMAGGNFNAVIGGNAETFKTVNMVIGQTSSLGKLTTENWNQLIETVPGGSKVLQDTMRKNGAFTGDFATALANGEITAEEFRQAIMEIGMDDMAVEAATATDTFEGAFGNLEASIVGGLTEIVNELKPFITEWTNGFAEKIKPALEGFKDVLVDKIIPGVKDFANNLKGIGEWIDENSDWLAPLTGGLALFVSILGGLQLGLYLGTIAVVAYHKAASIAGAVQDLFNKSVLKNPYIVVAAALIALVTALVYFFTQTETGKKAWEAFTTTVKILWDGFSKFMSNIWDNIVKFFDGGVKGAKNIVETLSKWVGDRFNDIKNAGDAVGRFFTTDVPNFFGRAKDAIAERFAAVKDGILKPIKTALDWINDNFIKKINGFLGTINISWRLPELSIPGYSDGGYTGAGHWLKPAGIVHAGEIVWSQKDIRRHGGIAAVEAMRLRGYSTGGIVANATQGFRGYDPKALAAMLAWAKATGRTWHMTGAGGARDYATQARLYAKYLAGHGPLAANPARGGPHMYPAVAMDLSPRPGEHAASRALLPKFGLGLTVRGEPWHIGYLGGRSGGTTKGGFNPFGFMEGLLDGIKFAEPIGSIVKAALKEAVKGIQLFDNGGWLKPGHIGFNASTEPEAVFTKAQLKRNMGNTYVFNGIEVKSQRVEEILDELAQEITRYSGVGV